MIKALMLLLGAGKFGKVLLTSGTMLLSVFTYALFFGWPYAAGFVLLIFVHEMGHYIAARQRGLKVGAPTFIPFVGAWIEMKDLPHDAETEAYVGLAGPLAGTLGAFVCYFLARWQHSDLLLALAYAGFMLNLFNMLPLSPLDGGRITAVISPKIWWVGAPLLVALFMWRPSPMLILIAILAVPQLLASRRSDGGRPAGYYEIAGATRANYAVWYLGLLGVLALLTFELHGVLKPI
jgi:Zn-dependent protease